METKMTGAIKKAKAGIFYIDDLTAEQRLALTQKCNDAYARALLRRLRAAIQFAQAEPDTRPVYDEDTGEFGPQQDYHVRQPVRSLMDTAMECRICSLILKELGWTEDMRFADWDTMLQHLPAERIQPQSWPGM
jgi:hypothetical protein